MSASRRVWYWPARYACWPDSISTAARSFFCLGLDLFAVISPRLYSICLSSNELSITVVKFFFRIYILMYRWIRRTPAMNLKAFGTKPVLIEALVRNLYRYYRVVIRD